ncbi:hypothetical protein [Haladaptatus halobius]|nr:hypothetical protein [Haladaptatus halobius]
MFDLLGTTSTEQDDMMDIKEVGRPVLTAHLTDSVACSDLFRLASRR